MQLGKEGQGMEFATAVAMIAMGAIRILDTFWQLEGRVDSMHMVAKD